MEQNLKIGNHLVKYTYDIIIRELLPHLGNSTVKKAYFLGLMVKV